jgi:hypothetical protein
VVVFTNEIFKNQAGHLLELYAVPKWVTVTQEGPPELFFNPQSTSTSTIDQSMIAEMPDSAVLLSNVNRVIDDYDLAQLRADSIMIDDDNEPAPENIPENNSNNSTAGIFTDWKCPNVCSRKKTSACNYRASLLNVTRGHVPGIVEVFEHLFPSEFLTTTILHQTNLSLRYIKKPPLSYGEFLRWIGLWFFMATTAFQDHREFWSSSQVSELEGVPFRLNKYMSRTRFEDILQCLCFTKKDPPPFRDPFWQIRDLISAWNENMESNFRPSWISCLDESMSKWVNKFTCPGFIVVPRKPWPMGNEYHTIACGESGVLYQIELVEGKDQPRELGRKEYSEKGTTVGLLMHLTKPIWHKGNVLVLDSGFCVLQGIAELNEVGVFAQALVKKRRYWPKFVKGEEIQEHFAQKPVGSVDIWNGELEGREVYLHCLKEPDYVMTIMSSFGTAERVGASKKRTYSQANGQEATAQFQYPELIARHYDYHGKVDDHNSARMFPIALEETWRTHRWENRVFSFILGITEINCQYVLKNIYGKYMDFSTIQFRKRFANALINNSFVQNEVPVESPGRRSVRNRDDCCLVSIPPYKTFKKNRLVACKTRYIQLQCSNCFGPRCRTYCSCDPGNVLCNPCFVNHVRTKDNDV